MLYKLGEYQAAEEIIRQVLQAREKALGKKHPETLTSVLSLGSVLQSQGKYKDAEDLSRLALKRK